MRAVRNHRVFLLLLIFFCGSVFILNNQFKAAPVSGRILESIEVEDDIHRSQVKIQFSFPIRYESHFPKKDAKTVRINFRPMTISAVDLDALFQRESVIPHRTDLVPLESVVFEAETLGNEQTNLGNLSASERKQKEEELRTESDFYLILSFSRHVAFAVEQGSDFRSIVVYVCEHAFSEQEKICEDYQADNHSTEQNAQE